MTEAEFARLMGLFAFCCVLLGVALVWQPDHCGPKCARCRPKSSRDHK